MINVFYVAPLQRGRNMTEKQQQLLDELISCGGYYECQKDPVTKKRLTPLVGFTDRKHVGEIYYNFPRAEKRPAVLLAFAEELLPKITKLKPSYILAATMGGICLSNALSLLDTTRNGNWEFGYPDKIVKELPTVNSREKSVFEMRRHSIPSDANVFIVEDICNNFTNSLEMCNLVASASSHVLGIGCAIDCSTIDPPIFNGRILPVISAIRRPTYEYSIDDPRVAEDIALGLIVWKPKLEWNRLLKAMNTAKK